MTITFNEEQTKGTDKIAKYNWISHDQPGLQMMIPKGDLTVDPSYQRTVHATDLKVKRIASEWSWIACGSIIVADRDGEFFVIDGQHRVLAARKRSDISRLPCIVFASVSPQREAEGFLRANRNRKPMKTIDAFKGMLVAGDPIAQKVLHFAERAGRHVGDGGGSTVISCVAAVIRIIETDEDIANRIWPLVVSVCQGQSLHGELMTGLFELERTADGQSITDPAFAAKILRIGYFGLLDGIAKAKAYHGKSGARVWAIGLANAINHGQRTHKIVLRGEE